MKRVIFTTMLTLAMAVPYAAATASNFFTKTNTSASANAAATVDAKSLTRAQVRLIQRALVANGYEVETDGLWRAGTRSAVQVYQNSHGISANGALTPETLAGLGIDLNAETRTEAAAHATTDTAASFANPAIEPAAGSTDADARFSGDASVASPIRTNGSVRAGGSANTGMGIAGGTIGSNASAGAGSALGVSLGGRN